MVRSPWRMKIKETMATMEATVSIIVPVYNIIEYLPRCVESLRKQTYEKIEIMLVDDGSTDGTDALCDELATEDPRIRVFHKENGGSSSARNLGIKEATGEYLGFVDSDDYVEPDMYERLLHAIETTHLPIAQTGRDEIDPEGRRLPNICEPVTEEQEILAKDFLRELLMHRGDCSFCTKLVRRDLFDEEGFPVGVLNEDFHLLVKLLTRGKVPGIVCIPGQSYHVFYRPDSNTRKQTGFSRVYADNVDNADMVQGLVKAAWSEDKELADIAFRFGIFQRLDYLLHIPTEQMTRDNVFYRNVVKYMRKNWCRAMKNPYLTKKNKCYHTIFTIAPKGIRVLHKKVKHIE